MRSTTTEAPSPVRRALRWLRRGLAALALGAGVYLLAAPRAAGADGSGRVVFGLIAGPIHYDFLLPADAQTVASFGFARPLGLIPGEGEGWVFVGWGAREFFMTVGDYSDVSARALWRAVTGDGSVLRLGGTAGLSAQTAERAQWLEVSAAEYAALLATIRADFDAEPGQGPAPLVQPGALTRDRFFPARGGFHIFRTCNQWVGEKLRAAGLTFGLWTPTPYSVRLSLARFVPPAPPPGATAN